MSDEGGGEMLPYSRRHISPSAAAPLDDDDILGEILLRLPLQPSFLPRASLVCKPWRRLATGAAFLRRYRAHHRNPPVLGLFHRQDTSLEFIPTLDPPDSIPRERFSLRVCDDDNSCYAWIILGCRHGRVLIFSWKQREILVFDPVSGDRRTTAVPPEFVGERTLTVAVNGAVLCAAGDDDPYHVHGSCHQSPFKVVLVGTRSGQPAFASVYSSETGGWGDLVSAAGEPCTGYVTPLLCTLVGNALYWWLTKDGDGILEFDLGSQTLAVINKPHSADIHSGSSRIVHGDDGGLRLAVLLYPSFQMWDRKVDSHGVATWVLRETFNMHEILNPPPTTHEMLVRAASVVGYSEDAEAIFVSASTSCYSCLFIVPLVSMQPMELYEDFFDNSYHPFTSFYPASPPLLQLPAAENYVWANATAEDDDDDSAGDDDTTEDEGAAEDEDAAN